MVSSTAALIDPVAAGLKDGAVELIVEAGDAERAAVLAIAEARTMRITVGFRTSPRTRMLRGFAS